MLVVTLKIRFYPLCLKSMKNLHFQCRPFWIANYGPHGQIPRLIVIFLKLAYIHYPVYQFSCFYHKFEQLCTFWPLTSGQSKFIILVRKYSL